MSIPETEVPEAIDTMVSKAPPPPAKKGGRERRQHGRLKVTGGYVTVGNIRFSLVDISMGGFQMGGDNRRVNGTDIFEGTIIWPDGGRHGTVNFKARAVRVESDSELIGAAFEPMEGEQIDQLLGMLSAIEGKWRAERERAERAETRRRMLRRLVASISIIGIVGGLGWVVWVLEPFPF
jgi:hypothetical protein